MNENKEEIFLEELEIEDLDLELEDPEEAAPIEPAKQTVPEEKTVPAEPVKPAGPVEPARKTEPVKPAGPAETEPERSRRPVRPVRPAETGELNAKAARAEQSKTAEAAAKGTAFAVPDDAAAKTGGASAITDSRSSGKDMDGTGELTPDSEDGLFDFEEEEETGKGGAYDGQSGLTRRLAVKIAACAAAALIACLGGIYLGGAGKYRTTFFPNTSVNGIPVAGLTSEQTIELLNQEVRDYTIKISAREADDVVLDTAGTGLHYDFGDSFDRLIAAQNPYAYGRSWFGGTEYRIDTLAVVDEDIFRSAMESLPFLKEDKFREPKDAKLSDYVTGSGYSVIPEESGTALDKARAEALIREAVCGLQPELDLAAVEGLYREPAVLADDPALTAKRDELNRFVTSSVTYKESGGLKLDGDRINSWLIDGGNGTTVLDEAAVRGFVKEVADLYDTYNKAKPFHTSWGQDITIRGGSYGWRVNQDAETAWIMTAAASGQKTERMPEFSKVAAAHKAADYGDTYVEVNLTAQHLYFYKNGSVVESSDFVSGNISKGTPTHTGIYQVAYKQKDAVLRGENYASPVDYWMPFNGGEGLHDAKWRSSFGGDIYKTSGSHGCVNLPHSAAQNIFNNISAGTPVIVYTLTGTSADNSAVKKTPEEEAAAAAASQAAAESAAAASQAAAESAAAESAAAASQAAAQGDGAPTESRSEAPSGGSGTVKPQEPSKAPETSAAATSEASSARESQSSGMVQPAEPAPVSSGSSDSGSAGPGGSGSSGGGSSDSGSAGPGGSGSSGGGSSDSGSAGPGGPGNSGGSTPGGSSDSGPGGPGGPGNSGGSTPGGSDGGPGGPGGSGNSGGGTPGGSDSGPAGPGGPGNSGGPSGPGSSSGPGVIGPGA